LATDGRLAGELLAVITLAGLDHHLPALAEASEPLRRRGLGLVGDPGEDRLRVSEHGPVSELQRRKLRVPGCRAQLLA
jgi:hypothetical protein